jgi:hypothetical protein
MIIDKVFKLVDIIAAKDESTGYISSEEKERLGDMAQAKLLDSYLGSKNDSSSINHESVSDFKKEVYLNVINGVVTKPDDFRLFQTASYVNTSNKGLQFVPFEELRSDEWNWRLNSDLDRPDKDFPALTVRNGQILIEPNTLSSVKMYYIFNPPSIEWKFTIVNGRKVYTDTGTVDFTFGEDEIENLVYAMLELAGVSFREADVVQYAMAESNRALQG